MNSKLWWCLGGIIAVALFAWAYDYYEQVQGIRTDLVIVEAQRDRAEANWKTTRRELNEKNKIIATLRERPPTEITRTVIKKIPADCELCIANYQMPIRVDDSDGLWTYRSPDIFSDPGELELTPKFDQVVIQPYRDALDECESKIRAKPVSPLRFRHEIEARAGVGMFGYEGQVSYSPLEFGGQKFKISPVAWVSVGVYPDVVMSGAVGVQVEIGR